LVYNHYKFLAITVYRSAFDFVPQEMQQNCDGPLTKLYVA